MSKYIIKNCPNYFKTHSGNYYCDFDAGRCQDCTDCVMKQIVERCKESMDHHSKDMFILGKTNMAGIVLALLQIEEVSE